MLHQRHPHIFATATVVALLGAITGLGAAGRVGPFASLGVPIARTAAVQWPSAPLRADSLFPAPTPPPAVHKVIVISDLPPRASAPVPTSRPLPPSPSASPTQAPTPAPSPTPGPCDDCGGGGDD